MTARERTPAAWAEGCLASARKLHADYALNPLVDGARIELLRPDPSGLRVSLNFVLEDDTYHLGFALLLSDRPSDSLRTPLLAGARFDSRRSIERQYLDDFALRRADPDPARRPPAGLWSCGEWRSNTLPLVERGLAAAEEGLLPRYLAELRAGAARLARVLERAETLVPQLLEHLAADKRSSKTSRELVFTVVPRRSKWPPEWEGYARALDAFTAARGDPAEAVRLRSTCCGFTALEIARGKADAIAPELVIINHFETFRAEADRLPAITALARGLTS